MCPQCPVCGIVRGRSMAVGRSYTRGTIGERRRRFVETIHCPHVHFHHRRDRRLPRLPRVDIHSTASGDHTVVRRAIRASNILYYSFEFELFADHKSPCLLIRVSLRRPRLPWIYLCTYLRGNFGTIVANNSEAIVTQYLVDFYAFTRDLLTCAEIYKIWKMGYLFQSLLISLEINR